MANVDALMTSTSVEWSTPRSFFDKVNAEFKLNLDVCASALNAKTRRYYTKADDGLSKPWKGRVWCNPPYGDGIAAWVQRCHREVTNGNAKVVVALVPARTDTSWFHDHVIPYAEVRFVRARIKFLPTDGRCVAPTKPCPGQCKGHVATFPSALCIYGDEYVNRLTPFEQGGLP